MFFGDDSDFVVNDPRKDRGTTTVSAESLNKRCSAILPEWLIQGKSILDLGSCLGAFGHWALSNGASHYTGVEFQKQFADTSIELLSKHHQNFTIINSGIEEFLKTSTKYDIVVACGVIHGVTDVIGLIKLISDASNEYVIIENLETDEREYPSIHFKPYRMVKSEQDGSYNFFSGITPIIGSKATTYLMTEFDYDVDGGKIVPERIVTSHDAYTELVDGKKADISPHRFILRYKKRTHKLTKKSLQYSMDKGVGNPKKNVGWKFDASVAARFQHEARTNIPDYDRVIDLCLRVAQTKFDKSAKIIDVGSALGHTLDVFIKAGYNNISGVECSQDMINNSLHKEKVILSDRLPGDKYDMILINWTLHFIEDKKAYLDDAISKLNAGGVLIVSDKTTQSPEVETLYYDFKRSNGVSEEYIQEKKLALVGKMFTDSVDWYVNYFKTSEIINSRYGFVTLYYETL